MERMANDWTVEGFARRKVVAALRSDRGQRVGTIAQAVGFSQATVRGVLEALASEGAAQQTKRDVWKGTE